MAKKTEELTHEQLTSIHNELRLAEKRNETELVPVLRKNLFRYVGEFVPDVGVEWDIILNEVYPIIQFNIPSIYFRNPKVFLRPRNKTVFVKRRNLQTEEMEMTPVDGTKLAKTQEAVLNFCLDDIGYKREVQRVLFDALLGVHGVLWHGYKGDFGMTEEMSYFIRDEQIFVKRINPTRFLFDPAKNMANLDEARWVGRSFDMPLDDILEDDTLDIEMEKVKGFEGYGDIVRDDVLKSGGQDIKFTSQGQKTLIDYADSEYKKSRAVRFIRLYEIFRRPNKAERKRGEKGKIILLTKEQQKPLRVSDWNYQAKGFPAKVLQFNELPDSIFGLDDVKTYQAIVDNKNIIRNLQIRNAQESSKVWIALAKDGQSEEDLTKIKVGDQTIIMFDGDTVNGKMQVMSGGAGASNELYIIDQRIDKELQDKSGVSDLKRGFANSGEESATSIRQRSAGGAVRPQYRQDIMADFLKDSIRYINNLLKQFMPYKDAVRITGSLDIEWSDTPDKETMQAETDIELDVLSMLPENPDKEMAELQQIIQMIYQAVTTPAIGQKLATEGYTFNLAPVIESLLMRLKIRNPDVFRRIKAEESLGFASVQQLKGAHANVLAALQGQQPPFPPDIKQDHRTFIEVYESVLKLLEMTGTLPQVMAPLQEMLQMHMEMEKELQMKEDAKAEPVTQVGVQ